MFEWLTNFGLWLSDVFNPFIAFFKSLIHGFRTVLEMFPLVKSIIYQSIGYLPSIFAVFITITVAVYIVYLIVGRNAGGTE